MFVEEFRAHLAWHRTPGLTEVTEHGVTVINIARFEAVMTMVVELNASIFKNTACLLNVMIWGMRPESW